MIGSNKESSDKALSPLHNKIAVLRGEAYNHDLEMQAKYGWSSGGYANWHDGEGRNREYPSSYSNRYFFRFVELFFSIHSGSDLIDSLERDFIGDDADAWRIKILLNQAEGYGLFNPGDSVCLYQGADGDTHIEHAGPGVRLDPRFSSSDNTYYGSEANKGRRKMIRAWLKIRAKELRKTAVPVSAAPPDNSELRETLIKALAGHLHFGVTPEYVAGFIVGEVHDPETGKRKATLPTRFWAIAEGLRAAKIITDAPYIAVALGKAFGKKMSRRRSPSDLYDTLIDAMRDAAHSMKPLPAAK